MRFHTSRFVQIGSAARCEFLFRFSSHSNNNGLRKGGKKPEEANVNEFWTGTTLRFPVKEEKENNHETITVTG